MKKFLYTLAFAVVSCYSVAEHVQSTDKDIEDSVCSGWAHSGINYFVSTWDFIVPVLGEVTKQIIDDTCPSGNELESDKLRKEFNARIDELSSTVSSLDERLTAVGVNVTSAVADLYKLQGMKDIDKFEAQLENFDNYYDKYKGILKDSDYNFLKDTLNNKSDKLSNFKAFYSTSNDFKVQFTNTEDIIRSFTNILGGSSVTSLKQALDGMCKEPKNIADDIILTRQKCNNIITYITLNVTDRMLKVKLMLNDIIKTEQLVNEGLIPEWFKLGSLGYDMRKFNNNKTSWADASAKVNELIDTHYNLIQSTLIGIRNRNLYKPLDGFPININIVKLKDSIKKAGCSEEIKWYSNITLAKPYIVIACKQNPWHYVTAKYYLNGGENVKNIFGVLVPVDAKQLYSDPITINYNKFEYVDVAWKEGSSSYKMTTTQFNLKSDLRLDINSNLVPKYYGGEMIQEANIPYVRSEATMPLYPLYYQLNGTLSNEFTLAAANAEKPSQLLDVVGNEGKNFTSSVRNFAVYSSEPGYMLETKANIFLSFEKNGFAYSFGLRIHNFGGILITNLFGGADFSKGYGQSENISLICLADTQCKVEGKQIIWNDGTYIDMSGIGNNLSLSFGIKPNSSK